MESFEEIGLILYEVGYAFCEAHGIVKIAKRLTAKWMVTEERGACEQSIICNEGVGCGRYRCPSRTITVSTFARRLEEIDYQLIFVGEVL